MLHFTCTANFLSKVVPYAVKISFKIFVFIIKLDVRAAFMELLLKFEILSMLVFLISLFISYLHSLSVNISAIFSVLLELTLKNFGLGNYFQNTIIVIMCEIFSCNYVS